MIIVTKEEARGVVMAAMRAGERNTRERAFADIDTAEARGDRLVIFYTMNKRGGVSLRLFSQQDKDHTRKRRETIAKLAPARARGYLVQHGHEEAIGL